jgi:hypothetical protein
VAIDLKNILTGGISGAIEVVFRGIDALHTSTEEKDRLKLEFLKLHQAGEFKQIDADLAASLAQIEVNKAEASNPSLFVSGWRPGAGWVCVIGLLYNFLLQPLLVWLSLTQGWETPPDIPMGDLTVLLGGLLGLSGFRSSDKRNGVASK